MNTHALKTTLTTIGLLAAGAILHAQTDAGSYVLPKTSAPNFYLEAGAGFMRADAGDDLEGDLKNFAGGSLSFGYRINKAHKVQVEIGTYVASDSESDAYVGGGVSASGSLTLDLTAVPVLVSYSYCIPLDPAGRCEIRLTPVAGLYSMKAELSGSLSYVGGGSAGSYAGSTSDTDTALAFGAGVGFTYHFSQKFYLDAGYRFLHTGKTEYDLFDDVDSSIKATNNHCLSVSFGWKF
ncbi:MAG: porin family protein [Opitutaceae bacterium]|jgi:opacity protein-like surface antigen|nr:porin family protein [Opitutaceae bacterium]